MSDNGIQRLLEKNSENLIDFFKQSSECALKMAEETKRAEREYIRLLSKYDSDMIDKIISMTSCSIFDVEDYINKVQFTKEGMWLFDTSSLKELSEQLNSNNQERITQLKSQLKYCKNHMQRLNIERELNKLYKNKEKINMFNSKRIKELEDRVFRLEYPNGKLLCLHQVTSNPYSPYKKRDLIFEYKMNQKIVLDSGYYSLVDSKIERVSNNLFKIEATIEHCWIASCKTIDYYLVDISKNV